MDVLRPEVIWIEGRCYRLNHATTEIFSLQEHDLYESEVAFNDDDMNDEDDNVHIVQIDNNRYSTSLHVSKHYIGSVIGRKGAIKMRIERDTRTNIKIPRQGQSGDVQIFGPAESNVRAAVRRINIIVLSSRMKQRATHFISIPMNDSNIVENFNTFKEAVLKQCPSRGLEESIFMRAEKLHLTLGVMCLMDNEERLHVSKLLNEAKDTIIIPLLEQHLPIRIRLKGLSYMNDDPREVDVLYGRVQEEGEDSGLVQALADALVDYFYKAGFMDRDHGRDSVKLHVTLINSKYRKQSSAGEQVGPKKKQRESFDASAILDKFGNLDFGVMELTDIHLSQRHCVGPDGYYQPTCVISCHK